MALAPVPLTTPRSARRDPVSRWQHAHVQDAHARGPFICSRVLDGGDSFLSRTRPLARPLDSCTLLHCAASVSSRSLVVQRDKRTERAVSWLQRLERLIEKILQPQNVVRSENGLPSAIPSRRHWLGYGPVRDLSECRVSGAPAWGVSKTHRRTKTVVALAGSHSKVVEQERLAQGTDGESS